MLDATAAPPAQPVMPLWKSPFSTNSVPSEVTTLTSSIQT